MGSELKKVCVSFVLLVALSVSGFRANAQQSKSASPGAQISPQQAITLAEQGHCRERISALKRAMVAQVPAETENTPAYWEFAALLPSTIEAPP